MATATAEIIWNDLRAMLDELVQQSHETNHRMQKIMS